MNGSILRLTSRRLITRFIWRGCQWWRFWAGRFEVWKLRLFRKSGKHFIRMTLHSIPGRSGDARSADVLFIHGLGGNAFGTWRHGEDQTTSWPHWMGKEFPDVGVWSLGYAASPTKRLRGLRRLFGASRDAGRAMHLPDRAGQVLDRMVQRGFGERPILFICHSLGGLLAKQILRMACDSTEPRKKAIFTNARAVLFLATPHTGATLASMAQAFRIIIGPTASMKDLQAHDAHLRELLNWYRNHSPPNIQTATYFETREVKGFRIVNETSAHPGIGRDPVGLDEDHLSIAKPRNESAQVCDAARELLNAVKRVEPQQSVGMPLDSQENGAQNSVTDDELLQVLKKFPAPWFEQLVFKFDTGNAVSGKQAAQSMRSTELIEILRVIDPDFSHVLSEIERLKGNRP